MKHLLLGLALWCPILLLSQSDEDGYPAEPISYHDHFLDTSLFHLGFHVGYTSSYFFKQHQPGAAASPPGAGIRLGIYSAYDFSPFLAISPKVELTMNSSHLKYSDGDGITHSSPAMSSSLQLMGHLLIKIPRGSYKPFLTIGPNLRIPVKQENLPQGNYGYRSDVAMDVGIGCEKVLKPFSIQPEIRYSYGFRNINLNPYSGPLYFHQLSLILAFTE